MPPKTLASYLDAAMTAAETDSVKLEREHGLPASWTRSLKTGRIKDDPDPDRVARLARALSIPEVEIWRYLGRFDRVAILRGETPPGLEEQPPAWAVELMRRVDQIGRQLDLLTAAAEGVEQGRAEAEREIRAVAEGQRLADEPSGTGMRRRRGTQRGSRL